MSLPDAKKFGAIALFGETYDEDVRVVQVGGPWSRELCGGTHVSRSSQIGLVSLTSESSVGSGSRRIEALVGIEALNTLHQERNLVRKLAQTLKAPAEEVETRIADSLEELRVTQRELAALQSKLALAQLPALLEKAQEIAGKKVLAQRVEGVSSDALKELTSSALSKLGENSVVMLGTVVSGAAVLMCAVGKDLQGDIKAGSLVKIASEVLGGGGGGRPDFAQGGGPNGELMTSAIDKAISSL